MSYEDSAPSIAAKSALWALPLLDEDCDPGELGAIAIETSQRLRTLALMALLGRGNDQQFLANLSRSARAWALFLRRAKGASVRPHHYVSGRLEPILDGIAAGDWVGVSRISSMAPAEKQGRSEYEDDFCYARLLLGLSAKPVDKDALGLLIQRFRKYEDGARVAACEALLNEDGARFAEAIPQVIERFETDSAELAKRTEDSPELTARTSVCIEALALLRLAGQRSMPTDLEYPFCPSLARIAYSGAFPEEFGP